MKINIIPFENKYSFQIVGKNSHILFSSDKDHSFIPIVSNLYDYAWEAYRDANKISAKCSSHIDSFVMRKHAQEFVEDNITVEDISAEQMILEHYEQMLDIIIKKAKGAEKGDEDDRDDIFKEIKMIVTELETIRDNVTEEEDDRKINELLHRFNLAANKYFLPQLKKDDKEEAAAVEMPAAPMQPEVPMMAAVRDLLRTASIVDIVTDSNLRKNIVEGYAEKTCEAIQNCHRGAVYSINEDGDEIKILEVENEEPILRIGINEMLNVDSIVPTNHLYEIYPLHRVEFYQRYWKPIVESIGHFYIDDFSLLIVPDYFNLPDIPKDFPKDNTIKGWDVNKKNEGYVDVSFRGSNNPIWVFDAAKSSRFANDEVHSVLDISLEGNLEIGDIVKCIDPVLETLSGRTGIVSQLHNMNDHVECDVDFGEGLNIVRLTIDTIGNGLFVTQIEKVEI